MSNLYFDSNASTCVAPEVAETLSAVVADVFGNPSSVHRAGQIARQRLEQGRASVAKFLGASPNEIVFTSGGTEAINLAILGLVRSRPGTVKHVVTTTIEHPAVLESCRHLEREGIEVTYTPVDRCGVVDVDAIRANLRPETVLVTVMHANNETGMIQPVREVAEIVREHRSRGNDIYLHSDGIQAAGKIDLDVHELGVDLYSISAHKLYAPKGAGALFIRKDTRVERIQHGGRHERDRRAGTENVPGACALARATELCADFPAADLLALRDRFEAAILSRISDVEINGAREPRLPNTSNLMFRGVSGESLLIALDMKGMAVSTGSACSSGSIQPSHVLLAMGRTKDEARSCVRFSFGRYNTAEDVEQLIEALVASVRQLRKSAKKEPAVLV